LDKERKLSLLYVGSLARWSNSSRRYQALSKICHTVAIDTDPYLLPKMISGVQHYFNVGPGIFFLNRKVRKECSMNHIDIVFVDNKSYLTTQTLRYLKKKQPAIRIANLITDDPFGKYSNSWRLFKETIFRFDVFFVQRKINVEEFKSKGAKRVELCYRSFDPDYNKPVLLDKDDQKKYAAPVGFVGTYESERASFVAFLIENGIQVSVIGNDWPNGDYWKVIQPFYRGPSVFEEEYVKAINGLEIALHFLRHGNRDEQDSRTFEIPSCRVFMIAERSQVHETLFKENEEAVFFTSKEELLEKVRFYLNNKEERERIALNGYKRCVSSGYSHADRMRKVIKSISEI
jgi:hypothetical protein